MSVFPRQLLKAVTQAGFAMFVFCTVTQAQVPTITGISPDSGTVGNTIVITGTNFNTTPASNAVYFGLIRATVLPGSTSTSLSVTVPAGASASPITLINTATGLQATSTTSFRPLYTPRKGLVTTADFAPKVDFSVGPLETYPYAVAMGDLDGDGKPEMVSSNRFPNTISVFRNTSTGGTISFAARQDFATVARPNRVAVADLNGDGRPDVIVSNDQANSISVFRNTSTTGTISFATRQDFVSGGVPWGLAIGDLNRDGKPEVAVCNNNDNTISIFRNNSTTTAISLGAKQDVSVSSGPRAVIIADLTNDGWPDLAASTYNSNAISILRSTSNTTTISFSTPAVDLATGGSFSDGLAAADLNRDNLPDLISLTNSSGGRVGVFRNTTVSNAVSFATRQDFATNSTTPSSVVVGDADGDGLVDIIIGHSGGSLNDVAVLRNASSGSTISLNAAASFAVSSTASHFVYDIAVGDLSGDGRLDIAAANWNLDAISVLRNNPCFPTAGTIGNDHVVPFPPERLNDSVLNVTLDLPATFNGQTFGTYRWEQSTNNIDWVAAKRNTTTPGYRFDLDSITQTTYYRRASNACFGPTVYSNVVMMKVQNPSTGIVKGFVRSKNGNPVSGVVMEAQKTVSLPGSPQSFVYRDTTNAFGEYTIQKIFFGDENDGAVSTNFTIRPTNAGRTFNPVSRSRLFTPVDKSFTNVDFVDTTAFSITGRVYQECAGCLNAQNQEVAITQGPLDSVRIFLDNGATSSAATGFINPPGEFGRYALTVFEPKTFKVEPKWAGRTFQPAFQNVDVAGNVSGIDFKDNTNFTITGKFSAGCGDYIGKARLEFYDVFADPNRPSVFRKWVWTNDTTGNYSITLPARRYRVKVETFQPSSDVSSFDLNTFFNGLPADSLTIDLSNGNRTFNLVYNRPPVIEITGLEPACGLPTAVLNQNANRLIPIKVWQGPINKGCPAADSTLTIVTNIQKDDAQETLNFRTSNGVALVTLKGGIPNVVAPFYKNLAASYRDRGGRVATANTNVVVAGLKQGAQTFTTVSPQIPLMVLHDPPGDQSKATWETSQTNETAFRIFAADAKEAELWSQVKLGQKWEAGTIFVNSEFNFWATIKGSVNVGANVIDASEAILSTTTTKSFSTADNPEVIGSQGDVFIGAALNFKYGIASEVYYDADSCKTGLRKKLLMANDGIATEYIFSENHIRNTLIPSLIGLRPFYSNQPEKLDSLNNQIRVWEQVLANNESNKARAPLVKNISFDGAVGPYTETTTTSATRSSSLEFNMTIDRQVALDAGFEVGGSGASVGGSVRFKTENGNSETNTTIKTTTFGFTLDDNDNGDYYSVNVKRDPVYNSPVFELVAGRTSCPYEEGTQPRDEFAFTVDQPVISGIDPTAEAVFPLKLQNLSPGQEARRFYLSINQTTNTGLVVKINGSQEFPMPFPIPDGGSATPMVSVSRLSGSNLFSFEGLQIVATDSCNSGVSKSVSLSAFFNATCSQVVLASPENGWLSNSGNNNIVPVIARGYTLSSPSTLSTLTLEYSRFGSNTWVEVATRTAAQLASTPSQTGFDWNTSSVPDGRYQLRLRINCTSGITYSQSAVGVIDRTPPIPVGKSEPVDDKWNIGDRITLVYNEALDVSSIGANNVQLIRLSNKQAIPISVTGFNNQIIINPTVDLSGFQKEVFRVRAFNVPDFYGNVRTVVDSLEFTIVPRVVSTSNKAITLSTRNASLPENVSGAGQGSAGLQSDGTLKQLQPLSAGDTTMSFYFTRPLNDTSIVRVNFAVSGTAVFGRDYLVSFDSVATDDKGAPSIGNTFNGTTGSIMIARSARTAILRIDPINNSIKNNNRTIIVTVLEGGDYDQGQTIVQQGSIVNDDNGNVYEFIGTGLFTTNSNWRYNAVPPNTLPNGDTIIINPAAQECILNVPLTLQTGSSLIINPGKLLRERK